MGHWLKALLATGIVIAPGMADASLIGSTVTGQYSYVTSPGVFGSPNLFDPASGYVPTSGYGNSAGAAVVIADPLVEFAALSGGGTVASPGVASISADFSASSLTVQESSINYAGNLSGFQLTFQDSAFAGMTIQPGASTFGFGGFATSLSGDTLTLTLAPDCPSGNVTCFFPPLQTATFTFTAVPLPASAWLMLSGMVGFGAIAHRRKAKI